MDKKIKNLFAKFKTELIGLIIFLLPFILLAKRLNFRELFPILLFVLVYLVLLLITHKVKYRKTLYYINPFLHITAAIIFRQIIMPANDFIYTYIGSFVWLLTAILLIIQAIRDKKINWFNALYLLFIVGFIVHILLSSVFGIEPL